MNIQQEYEEVLDNLIDETINLINKREELHKLHDDFQNVKNNGITAKHFRKLESEIKILEDKVSLLSLKKQRVENRLNLEDLDEDHTQFTVDSLDETEEN